MVILDEADLETRLAAAEALRKLAAAEGMPSLEELGKTSGNAYKGREARLRKGLDEAAVTLASKP